MVFCWYWIWHKRRTRLTSAINSFKKSHFLGFVTTAVCNNSKLFCPHFAHKSGTSQEAATKMLFVKYKTGRMEIAVWVSWILVVYLYWYFDRGQYIVPQPEWLKNWPIIEDRVLAQRERNGFFDWAAINVYFSLHVQFDFQLVSYFTCYPLFWCDVEHSWAEIWNPKHICRLK